MPGQHDERIYKRPYVRPNEKWVCGRAAEGLPCPHGPSRSGACHIKYECVPAKIGDRWICTRPDQYGGPCDNPALEAPSFGPTLEEGKGVCCRKVHCTPQRSLRAKRGVLSVALGALTVGLLLVGAGGPWRDKFFSPGPLTVHHQGASMASLEALGRAALEPPAANQDESCHICHSTLDGGLKAMLSTTLSGKTTSPQSAQCLVCHQDDLGQNGMLPHALTGTELSEHTNQALAEPFRARRPLSLALAALLPGVKTDVEGQIACAACHQEHNGALFDLTRMDNASCQSCHVKQFNSVSHGHPEFSAVSASSAYDYPYRRRTRMIYDHARHESNYFLKDENLALAPEGCASCHVVENDAGITRLVSFEAMCASCHMGNIVSARDEWINVFGYPSVEGDVYGILEEELKTPAIPRTAGKSLSPFMLLLLSGANIGSPERAPIFQADLAKVRKFEGDLSGLAYDDDPAVVARLFEGFKSLRDAAMDGSTGGMRIAFRGMLEEAAGRELDARHIDALLGAPKPGDTIESIENQVARKDIVELSGWHVRDSEYRLDPASWGALIGALEEYSVSIEKGSGGVALELFSDLSTFKSWFDAHIQVDGDKWLLKTTGDEAKSKDWNGWVDELAKVAAKSAPEASAEKKGDKAGPKTNTEPAEDTTASAPAEDDAFGAWFSNLSKVKRWFDANIGLVGGNWTLRAPRALYYRPVQHADPFIVAWLDLTGELYGRNPAAAMVFDQLSGRKTGASPGNCTKCHSIDAEQSTRGETVVRVNWKSSASTRDFTRFNHTPHLKLMDCAACHRADWVPAAMSRTQVAAASAEEEVGAAAPSPEVSPENEAPAAEVTKTPETSGGDGSTETDATTISEEPEKPAMTYLDSFKVGGEGLEISVDFLNGLATDGRTAFVSNFEPITKADCVRCHVPEKAGDSCLTCHNYHIQPAAHTTGIRSLNALIAEPAAQTEMAPAEEVSTNEPPPA